MVDSRPGDAFQIGDVINNTYRIEALLGRGGTSDVYKARNEVSGRLMALKVLKAEFSVNDDYLVLLKREEEIREVRHDSVVRYSENHRMEDGRVYLLMDFIDGPGLDRKLKDGPMSADDLLIVCRRVLSGLEAAHVRHIVHRDLSPDNIILRGGDPAQAVIIDFGIAKDTNPGAETIVGNEFAGKYAYAAPEQLNGQTDARTDLYSLGALLLANFRGAPPKLGNNPMEVIANKALRLDTDGVPEPLKTLIDRLADPDPDQRFSSAREVLAFMDAETGLSGEATIIPATAPAAQTTPPRPATAEADPLSDIGLDLGPAPTTTAPASTAPDLTGVPGATSAAPPPPAKTGGAGRFVVPGVALVVVAAGLGGYVSGAFDSFIGPQYPPADPFSLIIQQDANEAPRAVGFVPSEAVLDALTTDIASGGGSVDLTLASGDIGDTWGTDVLALVSALDPLDSWELTLKGDDAHVAGATTSAAVKDAIEGEFSAGLPGTLQGVIEIALSQLFLTAQDLEPTLDARADCGPLTQLNVPPTGYGPDSPVMVFGRIADMATRVELFDDLRAIAGDRQVVLDLELLNPTLCLIEQYLPKAPSGDVAVAYTIGETMEANPSGTFRVGENPVIDVVLPPNMTDGYLTVSILDVSGNVFHLLPNRLREDNAVATLRGDQTGRVPVRVAYSIAESAENGGLAFKVDDSTLGKSKVIALHSSDPLFDGLRPTSESAQGFAEALRATSDADANAIRSLDTRILVTEKPN